MAYQGVYPFRWRHPAQRIHELTHLRASVRIGQNGSTDRDSGVVVHHVRIDDHAAKSQRRAQKWKGERIWGARDQFGGAGQTIGTGQGPIAHHQPGERCGVRGGGHQGIGQTVADQYGWAVQVAQERGQASDLCIEFPGAAVEHGPTTCLNPMVLKAFGNLGPKCGIERGSAHQNHGQHGVSNSRKCGRKLQSG